MPPRKKALLWASLPMLMLLPVTIWWGQKLHSRMLAQQRGQIEQVAELQARAVERRFVTLRQILDGMDSFVEAHEHGRSVSQEEFRMFAAGLSVAMPWVRAFELVSSGVITHLYPSEGNSAVLGHNLAVNPTPTISGDWKRAEREGVVTVTGPIDLIQGGKGFVFRKPIGPSLQVAVVVDLAQLVGASGLEMENLGAFEYGLKDASGHLFWGTETAFRDDGVARKVNLPDGYWTIGARPPGDWYRVVRQTLLLFYASAATISTLLFLLIWGVANRQIGLSWAVSESTKKLGEELAARKHAEDLLGQGERRFRALIEHSSDGIVLLDHDQTVVYASPSVARIDGYHPEEMVGHKGLETVHPDDSALVQRFLQQLAESPGQPIPRLWRQKNKAGKWRWFEGVATNLVADPAVGAVVTNYRDVTHRMELEEQLRHAQKMEAIGRLAGGVAHDFNNLLSVIQLQAHELLEDPLRQDIHDELSLILESTERGTNLTRQLLLLSRKQPVQLGDLDLNEVVRSMSRMLRRALGADVCLETHLADDLPPVRADQGMLEQVILNLAVNARDALPRGGTLCLETRVGEVDAANPNASGTDSGGRYIHLKISDNGEGIPPENLARIFEPFFSTKEQGRGTGLGLASVYGIIQLHNGWITADSEVGVGTTFLIYLPVSRQGLSRELTSPHSTKLAEGTETVFVVEDEDSIRKLASRVLRRSGYQVVEAASGIHAREVWKECRDQVHLLLTDLVMPGGLTGQELAAELLLDKPSLKVIYASGYSSALSVEDLNGIGYLAKPYSPRQLASLVRETLDG